MQLPFDDTRRRRLYMVRHGQSASARPEHGVYGDDISLTEPGRREATAMREALAGARFDVAFCSDIRRTQETAAIILAPHGMQAVQNEDFTELRGDLDAALKAEMPSTEKLHGFAYLMWKNGDPEHRFFGGDHMGDYLARCGATLEASVRDTDASDILIVSHSGFQRAALSWVLDSPTLGLAKFEQDSCCLNILDIDVDAKGRIVRKHVRLANYTPLDPIKLDNRLTDGERMAVRLSDALGT